MGSNDHVSFDITHIADLARLRLTKWEKAQVSSQLEEILAYVGKVAKLRVGKVPPTFQTTGLKDVTRGDRVDSAQSLNQGAALANAPSRENGFFKVKRIQPADSPTPRV